MNDRKNNFRNLLAVAILLCLMRLIQGETNDLAKILEIILALERVIRLVSGLVSRFDSSNIDDGNL